MASPAGCGLRCPPSCAATSSSTARSRVDGVSLTVSGLEQAGFEVSLIPETLEHTTLGRLAEGDRVNIEVDQIARYTERLLRFKETG